MNTFNKIQVNALTNLSNYDHTLTSAIKEIQAKSDDFYIDELSSEYGGVVIHNGQLMHNKAHYYCLEKYFSFGIVIENGLEIFIDDGSKTIPIQILRPGMLFPIDEMEGFEHALPKHMINITAGARSIFLSPKISDAICFLRLAKKYNLELDIPKTLYDEWYLLANLARNSGCRWHSKVLIVSINRQIFFSKDCVNLRSILIQSNLYHHKTLKNKNTFDSSISTFLTQGGYKVNHKILDHVKQVCLIGSGMIPGFIFASNDLLAPVELFKRAFIETYGIKYAPHVIHPGMPNSAQLCYYPISSIGKTPLQRSHMTSLTQLKEIKKTLHDFQDFLLESGSDKASTILKDSEISYFHHQPDDQAKIKPSSKLPEIDPMINSVMQNTMLPFCDASPFLRSGCIAIRQQT